MSDFHTLAGAFLEASQFLPGKQIPIDVEILEKEPNPKGVIHTPDGDFFVYRYDWVLYDGDGLTRAVIKNNNFKALFRELF